MVVAVLLALLIGVSLGLLGGGGSILAVPLLVYVVGLGPRDAVATSLFVVGLASVAAVLPHARAGLVQLRVGLPFGAASMVGAFAGGRLAHLLPEKALLAAFTAVMVITALAMMRRRRAEPEDAASAAASGARALGRASLVGVAIGLLTGVVGAGGGFVIVPALVLLCGLPMRAAVGTSLLIIAMNSLAAFAGAVGHASVPWEVAGLVAASAMVGSLVGATLAKRIPAAVLRTGFAWFVLAMAIFMVWKQLPPALSERFGSGLVVGSFVAAVALVVALVLLRSRRAAADPSSSPSPRPPA